MALVPLFSSSSTSTPPPPDSVHRYHFGLLGYVKEILYPNKAVIQFKINDKDERAILLSKMFHSNGKPLDESQSTKQPISDFIKVGESLTFDCHIYDKGGDVGGGKDRCNYFVMKAQKTSEHYPREMNGKVMAGASGSAGGLRSGCQGWVSEIYSQNGVLTYSSNGVDQRVSFHASRVFIYEKRLGLQYSLEALLQLGEKVQFDAVPADGGMGVDFCPMTALMVWKGKRPAIDSTLLTDQQQVMNSIDCVAASDSRTTSRKGSVDSSSSSGVDDNSLNHSASGSFLIIPSYVNNKKSEVFRGIGMIAKIIDQTTGIIWWLRKPNFYNSVWFSTFKTFKFGFNLCNKSLADYVKEGI